MAWRVFGVGVQIVGTMFAAAVVIMASAETINFACLTMAARRDARES